MCKTILVCAGQSHTNQLSWILRGQFLEAQAILFYLEVSRRTLRYVLAHSDQYLDTWICSGVLIIQFWNKQVCPEAQLVVRGGPGLF